MLDCTGKFVLLLINFFLFSKFYDGWVGGLVVEEVDKEVMPIHFPGQSGIKG